MAYHESVSQKIGKLLKDPINNAGRVIPYLNSKFLPYKRSLFESLNIDTLSKPYPGHNKLLEYIGSKNGFFIECGGNDGYSYDPTYYLEKFQGWKGIIIEPLPIAKLCKKNRKASLIYETALVPFGYNESTIDFIDCNAMSFIDNSIENGADWIERGQDSQNITARKINVPAGTLQSVIDDYNKNNASPINIDFLVIDVEGFELEVMRGLNFKINSPSYILSEAHTDARFDKIKQLLNTFDYEYICEIGEKDYLFKLKK